MGWKSWLDKGKFDHVALNWHSLEYLLLTQIFLVYEQFTEQKSANITLVAGQEYYYEGELKND